MIAHPAIAAAQSLADSIGGRLGVRAPIDVRCEEWIGRTPDGRAMRACHIYRRGRHIVVLDRAAMDAIGTVGAVCRIAHEVAHAWQAERRPDFLRRYAEATARVGYARNPYERHARAVGARLAAEWAADHG